MRYLGGFSLNFGKGVRFFVAALLRMTGKEAQNDRKRGSEWA